MSYLTDRKDAYVQEIGRIYGKELAGIAEDLFSAIVETQETPVEYLDWSEAERDMGYDADEGVVEYVLRPESGTAQLYREMVPRTVREADEHDKDEAWADHRSAPTVLYGIAQTAGIPLPRPATVQESKGDFRRAIKTAVEYVRDHSDANTLRIRTDHGWDHDIPLHSDTAAEMAADDVERYLTEYTQRNE